MFLSAITYASQEATESEMKAYTEAGSACASIDLCPSKANVNVSENESGIACDAFDNLVKEIGCDGERIGVGTASVSYDAVANVNVSEISIVMSVGRGAPLS